MASETMECESSAVDDAIREMRASVEAEIVKLVQKQRLRFVSQGTLFPKYSTKGQRLKDKFWFCRLSPSQEFLLYGDSEDGIIPDVKELKNKFPVSEIRDIVIGRECPHGKELRSRKSLSAEFIFCLIPVSDQDEALHFVAPNDQSFSYWVDAIHVLLKKEMPSEDSKQDIESLLSMHVAVQLLDLEGLQVPQKQPPVPPLPSNFDFARKC